MSSSAAVNAMFFVYCGLPKKPLQFVERTPNVPHLSRLAESSLQATMFHVLPEGNEFSLRFCLVMQTPAATLVRELSFETVM